MSFAVSFDPFAPTGFFTVPDHQLMFSSPSRNLNKETITKELDHSIRELLGIPADWNVQFVSNGTIPPDHGWLVDPESGILLSKIPNPIRDVTYAIPGHAIRWPSGICVEWSSRILTGVNSDIRFRIHKTEDGESLHQPAPSLSNAQDAYVLLGVLNDLFRRGLEVIQRETAYKAAVLNHAIESHPQLDFAIPLKQDRSLTILAFHGNEDFMKRLHQHLVQSGILTRLLRNRMIIANFPSHSKETFEWLSDRISAFS